MTDQRELDEALAMLRQRERATAPDLDALRARVLAETQNEESRKKRWLLPVAAAAVVIAGVTAVQVTREAPEEVPPAAPASGVPLLEHAAKTNADGRWQTDGAYLHVVVRGTRAQTLVYGTIADDNVADSPPNSGYTELYEQRRESWVPFVPDWEWRETRTSEGEPRWAGGTHPDILIKPTTPWLRDGDWTAPCGNYFPAEKPKTTCGGSNDPTSPTFYETVPTEPAEILSWLRKHSSAPQDASTVFAYGVTLMASGVMPKERYANWYRALAMIEGVRDYGDVTLPDGKVGASLGVPAERERRELVIDRNDGRFLGERRVAGPKPKQSWIPAGTVLGSVSVTSERVPRPDGS